MLLGNAKTSDTGTHVQTHAHKPRTTARRADELARTTVATVEHFKWVVCNEQRHNIDCSSLVQHLMLGLCDISNNEKNNQYIIIKFRVRRSVCCTTGHLVINRVDFAEQKEFRAATRKSTCCTMCSQACVGGVQTKWPSQFCFIQTC